MAKSGYDLFMARKQISGKERLRLPLPFEEAVATILKVAPPRKKQKTKRKRRRKS
jgi:hypothetical protein